MIPTNRIARLTTVLVAAVAVAGCRASSGPVLAASASPAPAQATELVVLAHGMGRTAASMLPIELALEHAGYRVLNFGYSSYGPSVAEISRKLEDELAAELSEHPASRVHFVGHSLGNIVLRMLLEDDRPAAPLGRFVMLAPPNRGSAMADRFAPWLEWLVPPIGELRTAQSTVAALPPPQGIEFAIVAGRWDRKVSLHEACLAGVDLFATVPSGHTLLPLRPSVIRLVRDYLDHGGLSQERLDPEACEPPHS